jgi:hypothetical protein
MIWGVPAYGPHWQRKIAKLSRIFWRRAGWMRYGVIKVAPWNRTRRPIKRRSR